MQMSCNFSFFFRFSDSLLECALIWAGGRLSYLRCNGKIQGGSNMTGTNCDLFTHK